MDTDFIHKEETDLIIGSFKNPKLEVRRVVATTQNFIKHKKP